MPAVFRGGVSTGVAGTRDEGTAWGGGGRIVAGCSGTLCPAASTSYVEAVEDTQDGLFPHFVELWLQYSRVLGNLWFLWKNDASFPRPTRSCHTRYHGIASNRR